MEDKSEPKRRFAYALVAAMKAAGVKPPALAARLKVAPKTVNRWVNGEALPNILMVVPLANALSVEPAYLYDPKPVDVPTTAAAATSTAVATGATLRALRDQEAGEAPAQPDGAPRARPRRTPSPRGQR